jgi:hypothetical protein
MKVLRYNAHSRKPGQSQIILPTITHMRHDAQTLGVALHNILSMFS